MLFRFREAQAADLGIIDAGRTRRPKNIRTVESVPVCEKWRGQVLKEISRKMSRIQEPALSDYQVRDLNDEINRLMREKHAWEVQIRNLGGPNYMRGGPGPGGGGGGGGGRVYDEQGKEVPGASGRGYRYYGRARELPGVKELFEAARRQAAEDRDQHRKPLDQRGDLRRAVDAAYYGYAPGEEDDALLAAEAEKERAAAEHMAENGRGRGEPPPGWEPLPGDAGDGHGWDLPTLEEVQQELVDRRRRRLLDQL
jgi:pre-mRNA-splicing factor ISY1